MVNQGRQGVFDNEKITFYLPRQGDWVYFITFATVGNMGQSTTNCMTGTTETTTKPQLDGELGHG